MKSQANDNRGGCAARLAEGLWGDLEPYLRGLEEAEFRHLLAQSLRQTIGEYGAGSVAPPPGSAPS